MHGFRALSRKWRGWLRRVPIPTTRPHSSFSPSSSVTEPLVRHFASRLRLDKSSLRSDTIQIGEAKRWHPLANDARMSDPPSRNAALKTDSSLKVQVDNEMPSSPVGMEEAGEEVMVSASSVPSPLRMMVRRRQDETRLLLMRS